MCVYGYVCDERVMSVCESARRQFESRGGCGMLGRRAVYAPRHGASGAPQVGGRGSGWILTSVAQHAAALGALDLAGGGGTGRVRSGDECVSDERDSFYLRPKLYGFTVSRSVFGVPSHVLSTHKPVTQQLSRWLWSLRFSPTPSSLTLCRLCRLAQQQHHSL